MAQVNDSIKLYQERFVDIGFERAHLFKAIQGRYHCTQALYPGSSIHITPSLFFPHVVYVDQSSTAREFFADMHNIRTYIDRNKRYKRRAYVRFIAQDYTTPLALQRGEFDLLISLYAGSVSRACKGYLKVGGILLTNNHHCDIEDIVNDTEFQLQSVIKHRGGKYRFIDRDLDHFIAAARKETNVKSYLRSTSQGVAYRENVDVYFVFERCTSRKCTDTQATNSSSSKV
jgi:hypothetical protein